MRRRGNSFYLCDSEFPDGHVLMSAVVADFNRFLLSGYEDFPAQMQQADARRGGTRDADAGSSRRGLVVAAGKEEDAVGCGYQRCCAVLDGDESGRRWTLHSTACDLCDGALSKYSCAGTPLSDSSHRRSSPSNQRRARLAARRGPPKRQCLGRFRHTTAQVRGLEGRVQQLHVSIPSADPFTGRSAVWCPRTARQHDVGADAGGGSLAASEVGHTGSGCASPLSVSPTRLWRVPRSLGSATATLLDHNASFSSTDSRASSASSAASIASAGSGVGGRRSPTHEPVPRDCIPGSRSPRAVPSADYRNVLSSPHASEVALHSQLPRLVEEHGVLALSFAVERPLLHAPNNFLLMAGPARAPACGGTAGAGSGEGSDSPGGPRPWDCSSDSFGRYPAALAEGAGADPDVEERSHLQFGRISDSLHLLMFNHPLSAVQAFGIALTTFTWA